MSTDDGIHVESVERIDGTQIIVEFSDSTCATYTVAQLTAMAPERKPVHPPGPGQAPEDE